MSSHGRSYGERRESYGMRRESYGERRGGEREYHGGSSHKRRGDEDRPRGGRGRGRGRFFRPQGPEEQRFEPPTETEMKLLSHTAIRPRRPSFGSRGKPVQLWVNFYGMSFSDDLTVYHYDVTIDQKLKADTSRMCFREWVNQMANSNDPSLRQFSQLAVYDGMKNIFTPVEGEKNGKPTEYILEIKEVAQVSMNALAYYLKSHSPATEPSAIEVPRNCLQILEILLTHGPSTRFYTAGKGGGSFYNNLYNRSISNGLSIHFGWKQSLRPVMGIVDEKEDGSFVTYKQLLLNIDVAATAFYESGPLQNVLMAFLRKSSVEQCRQVIQNVQHQLRRHLKDVQIQINYRNEGRKRYKISNITMNAADREMIETDEGRISVAQFFYDRYGISLRYPWLPCVVCGTKNGVKIPFELCNVRENQRHAGKLSGSQTDEMIKVSAVRPGERFSRIDEGMKAMHGENDADFLKSWGVELDKNMLQVKGRVVSFPVMSFRTSKTQITDGTWDYRSQNFAQPGTLGAWGICVFGSEGMVGVHDVKRFFEGMMSALSDLGMRVTMPDDLMDVIVYQRSDNERVGDTLDACVRRITRASKKVDMIFCVLMGPNNPHYGQIKRISETEMGVMTQCLLSNHVVDKRDKRAYWGNIALKINVKLGGINHFLDVSKELPRITEARVPTMIIGFDVTHQTGASVGPIPAMVGCVGSMDPRYCKYKATVRAQNTKGDIVEDAGGMVEELFRMFKETNNVYPKRVVIYRDGVSEGQFGEVVWQEVLKIKSTFRKLCGDADMPTITFIVVSKRHHTRFSPVNEADQDRSGNVMAGTVVDRQIVHPFEFDFYLNSHPGLQGTSRPAHYHVLYDEHNFSPDNLQEFTYRLCYLVARSTRAISIVPSVYYADLVAYRAVNYVTATGKTIEMAHVLDKIQNEMFYI